MELLKKLYGIYSPSKGEEPMRSFLKSYCKANGYKYERSYGNIYVTKGISETYPCVVAHMDQVQKKHSADFEVFEKDGLLFGYSRTNRRCEGLGADDKNGIWVALKCLERFDVMKCAFFWGEEIGCQGSEQADMKFFDDCRFVLQCDRRNGNDFITTISGTELCSEEFIKDVPLAEFGYKETSGMLSDVAALKENMLGVSCCNMSCGYYSPHTDEETTEFSELLNCLEFVSAIIERCTKVYPHQYSYRRSSNYDWYGYNSYYPSYRSKTFSLTEKNDEPELKFEEEHDEDYNLLLEELEYSGMCGDEPLGWELIKEMYKDYYTKLTDSDFQEICDYINELYGFSGEEYLEVEDPIANC